MRTGTRRCHTTPGSRPSWRTEAGVDPKESGEPMHSTRSQRATGRGRVGLRECGLCSLRSGWVVLVVVGCPGRVAGLEEDEMVDTKTDCIGTKPLEDAWWTVKKGIEISVFSSLRK